MKKFMQTKAGVLAGVGSILVAWMLLAAGPARAHTTALPSLSCSSLPVDGFFTGSTKAAITSSALTPSLTSKKGANATNVTNMGDPRYHYAKITVPALAAGELRVFDSRTAGTSIHSDAILCRRGSEVASSRMNSNLSTSPAHGHAVFKIRAPVSPGDEEYILVVAQPLTGNPATAPATALTLRVAFHGAITTGTPSITSTLDRGDAHGYTIRITDAGLLTVETTGSTDTAGMLSGTESAMDDSSGSGNNFKMVLPVTGDGNYTVTVEGQTPNTSGAYTLGMDFKVAMAEVTLPTPGTLGGAPTWTNTSAGADDNIAPPLSLKREDNNRTDEDYFLFKMTTSGFLTVESLDDGTSAADADTAGALYGPTGEIGTDLNSGAGNNFRLRAPVAAGAEYLVKVDGSDGGYRLRWTFSATSLGGGGLLSIPGAYRTQTLECRNNDAYEICPPTGNNPLERERYVIRIDEPGSLYVHTTGIMDTVGALYGPAGSIIKEDDDSGKDSNFRIAATVKPGLHIIEVRGKTRTTTGVYGLVVNFVAGAQVTEPTTPTDPTTPTPPAADSTGSLEEPPHNGIRSGIGLIRGWVCQDAGQGVEIRIMNAQGERVATVTAPYGSDRGDVPVSTDCDAKRTPNVGFATQYNYNLLPAGTYTIQAFVDNDQIGRGDTDQTNTFRVVRISSEEFLRRLDARVRVEDFPVRGTTTVLEWDQPSQNFQILGVEQ